ncbi:hypothetical protein ABZP36_029311 [Zizania latifolia]
MPKPKPKGRRSACTTAPPPPQVPPPPAAPATNFIDITSSPDLSGNGISKKSKRPPPSPLDLDGIEMCTPRKKRRLDDECCILTADPLAAADVVPTATAAAANDDIAVVAERGKVRTLPRPFQATLECEMRAVSMSCVAGGMQGLPASEVCLRQIPLQQYTS